MNKQNVVTAYLISFMLVLSFVAYMSFTTPMPTRAPDSQEILNAQVPHAIPGPPPSARAVNNGEALVYMKIPRFGNSWFWTALEGADMDNLDDGPSHFSNTELPGEEGNSVFAAHRATHGDPFLDFDKLKIGDEVILLQQGAEWIYEVTVEPKIIPEDATWILDDFAPGEWLTLTTCWPKYGSEKRMYIRAELSESNTLTETTS